MYARVLGECVCVCVCMHVHEYVYMCTCNVYVYAQNRGKHVYQIRLVAITNIPERHFF